MALISITRLRVRLRRYLPPFGWQILLTARQAQRAPGFLGGRLVIDAKKTFWTMTAWQDAAAMRDYRSGGAHRSRVSHPSSPHVARQIAEPRPKNIERLLKPL